MQVRVCWGFAGRCAVRYDRTLISAWALQAFKDVRGKNPQAPQVLFTHRDPPAELQASDALRADNVGYITFGIERHGRCQR
jgi:actin related protein 2/3 complex subunit 2